MSRKSAPPRRGLLRHGPDVCRARQESERAERERQYVRACVRAEPRAAQGRRAGGRGTRRRHGKTKPGDGTADRSLPTAARRTANARGSRTRTQRARRRGGGARARPADDGAPTAGAGRARDEATRADASRSRDAANHDGWPGAPDGNSDTPFRTGPPRGEGRGSTSRPATQRRHGGGAAAGNGAGPRRTPGGDTRSTSSLPPIDGAGRGGTRRTGGGGGGGEATAPPGSEARGGEARRRRRREAGGGQAGSQPRG